MTRPLLDKIRRGIFGGLLIVSGLACSTRTEMIPDSPGTDANRPRSQNVIIILADDQGCGDLGQSGNPRLKTPNIDRLAKEGTTFTRFHVSPVCSPTRASVLTGRYHHRTGVRGVVQGREFMSEEEITLAEAVRPSLRTAMFGKWHLGENFPWTPGAQGFDESLVFRSGSNTYFDPILERNGKREPQAGYMTDIITNEAIAFVEKHQKDRFFMYLPYNAPHGPLEVPASYVEDYKDLPPDTAKLYGMMASLDENVGRLIDRLDQLALSRDTLVLYFSDNGPLWGHGPVARSDRRRFNCGLRDGKYSVHQGGIQLPLILRQPGTIAGNIKLDVLSAHIDVLPTVLDFLGLSPPVGVKLDGRSLRAALEGKSTPERTLFEHYNGESGDLHSPYPGGAVTTPRWKMVDGKELYDLQADPGESKNVAPQNSALLAELDDQFRSWFSDVTANRPAFPAPHVGHAEENPTELTPHWSVLSGGPDFQYGEQPPRYRGVGVHGDTIAHWNTVDGRIEWKVNVVEKGTYRIDLKLRCSRGEAGARVRVALGESAVDGEIVDCIDGAGWRLQTIGEIEIGRTGSQSLILSALSVVRGRVADVAGVMVERIHP
jgi:arylsulfatase A-like enzyme